MFGELVGAMTGSSVLAGGAGFLGTLYQNNENRLQAEWQRDWSERMSNTAHRREMADLQAAGLNPLLSAKLGGSSTPSSSTPVMQDPLGSAVNSALAARANKAQVELQEETARLTAANAVNAHLTSEKIMAETDQVRTQTNLTMTDIASRELGLGQIAGTIENLAANTDLTRTQRAHVEQQIQNLKRTYEILGSSAKIRASDVFGAQAEGEIDTTTYGKIMRYIDRAIKALTGSANSARDISTITK